MSAETKTSSQSPLSPLRWGPQGLELLDQTLLPGEETWILCERPEQVADAIRRLAVRGAPAIGVAAAYGLVLGLRTLKEPAAMSQHFDEVEALLASTRPTAVNLRWALARGRRVFEENRSQAPEAVAAALLAWAEALHAEDVEINRRMGEHGARLFAVGDRVLTHCNTGALATAGYGTA
ncbi:MAG TPA: S-methyl-5-thioribose-1-phosphate isomerase, partial [Granulicella sp.]|nr:S-methyl-5-thioribose-1-phosphate isomerase [Granulicella sp.]